MESISIANKILQDRTRFYGILEKNAMESISIANKILQDPKRFYGILEKNAMESISIANKILQDSTGYFKKKCSGIHSNSKEDPTGSCKILPDPTRFYGILDKNALESISIANKILQDSKGYLTKMLRNPYQ